MPSGRFDENVFVNCPFDDDYRQLLLAILFAVLYLGFIPRLSLERSDASESRIDKILSLIKESKYGIHDLSRMVSREENEHYRMNMPFELGVDFGCQKFKSGKWNSKQILILEKERYRYQAALSDLSGSDICNHDDNEQKAIDVVRNWFVPAHIARAASGNKIWLDYNDFQAFLYDELVEKDGHEAVDSVQIIEILTLMKQWLSQ